jgi:hypothetical protein
LPVSRFDPALVEAFAGLVVLRLLKGSFGLRTPMHKPVGRGLLLGLAPFGLPAGSAQIDDFSHARLGGKESGAAANRPLRL